MTGIRMYMQTSGGKAAAVGVASLFILIGAIALFNYMHSPTPAAAFYTTYVCTETGRSFKHRNQLGETIPIISPYSGKNTGVPAEACYWNADGTIKSEPTWVLLNEAVDKEGPTFCPDCGRLVVGHNPHAEPGMRPPPTQGEYWERHSREKDSTASREAQ